jgi:hypothetical protein
MGRNLLACCGLLIVIGLAFQPAQAGDRKSAKRGPEAAEDIVAAPKSSESLRSEMAGASAAKSFEASSFAVAGHRSSGDRGTPTDKEHKGLTFLHIHSAFGEIAVKPVVGQVNGAQFSLGF